MPARSARAGRSERLVSVASLLRPALLPVAATIAAAVPAIALWHFTVDDALIAARYADHVARGLGYRFNATGPSTDGVTPLGWACLLAPWGGAGPLAVWRAAKLVGLGAWLVAAAALGSALGATVRARSAVGALLLVLTLAPLGAWSVSGMETGLALALGTWAVVARLRGAELGAALSAGLVAGLRPETLPWALAFALAPGRQPAGAGTAAATGEPPSLRPSTDRLRALTRAGALGAMPFVLALACRQLLFGRPWPLALWAKPSDLAHGWRYALACVLLCGVVAMVAWRSVDPWCRGLQLAVLVHALAVTAAGGDWMPLSRLFVPVLPCVIAAAAHVLDRAHPLVGAGRLALALAGTIFAFVRVGPSAARVGPDRLALVAQLRAALASSRVVATLDIGWVGAATGAEIVDLAGVTDPAVAALPGGHTSKRIPANLLEARRVDTLVLLLAPDASIASPWTESHFARTVEARVAWLPAMATEFDVAAVSRQPTVRYVVLKRR